MKTLVKKGKKILGFVSKKKDGTFWCSFGKPSQHSYISFECNSIEQGIARIEMHSH